MNDLVQTALRTVVAGQTLDVTAADAFMNEWMQGRVTQAQAAALVSVMAARGEQPSEIAGFARAMRRHALHITAPASAIDTCGTGGDGRDTFNISTTVAFIAATAGIPVAKHGNRAASSRSGSADVLQALGAEIELSTEACERLLADTNLCFLFAQVFHPAMKYAAQVRRELGFRTIFNILGPLTNPANARRQVLGVFKPSLVPTVADALLELGAEHALVVHGDGGLDELSLSGPTQVAEVRAGRIETYVISPEEVGLVRAPVSSITGGTPAENADMIRKVLQGVKGPKRDVVLLNAGAALYVGGKAASIAEGVDLAAQLIDSGAALAKLEQFVAGTQDHAQSVQAGEVH
ncbi:anthranilate phosphoribosyltransferase [Alicyclobacillus hesperidum URH17-3-68]|uniref:Anthranilate phosphoribosyltransferase n=1 Tax=Alicyclobacillus hesperidum TaxID=89784 RepID=A0A1H2WQE7_9BACL|nr:anthranilate phosphoribosyltransferase [Alicyclobacillus hesperidum]EJY55027.1 anthranilate phosphoribosyltransferase [Alicyclobacillus hesperidum URH17-3-68]GLV12601.1 anthranilate phosphoribosyltransferase [Alicyclobacillus hesperidum]SDW82811.1 anthranilate phosphoribosyltransferase [Alicyclobacillus hesperidum]